MKLVKWKILFLTGFVCLIAMVPGLVFWKELPDVMPIHFDISGNPDGFASKAFVLLGLPFLTAFIQGIACVINDVTTHNKAVNKKIEAVTKWIIPSVTIIIETSTVMFALGADVNIRRVAMLTVGLLFVLSGNYMPKLNYVKNYKISTDKARKINRLVGFETVIMGILFLIGAFLNAAWSTVCLLLLIPYFIIALVYSIKLIREDSK